MPCGIPAGRPHETILWPNTNTTYLDLFFCILKNQNAFRAHHQFICLTNTGIFSVLLYDHVFRNDR